MTLQYVISLADSEVARIEPQGSALHLVLAATMAQAHQPGQPPVAGALLGLTLVVEQAHAQGLAVLGDGLGRLRSGVLHSGTERWSGGVWPWPGAAEGRLELEFANGSQISMTGSHWRLSGPDTPRFVPSYAC